MIGFLYFLISPTVMHGAESCMGRTPLKVLTIQENSRHKKQCYDIFRYLCILI